MDDLEPEQLQDDFEEKIIPLPLSDDALPSFPLRHFVKPHISLRQHSLALRLSLVLSFMLLALLVLSGSFQLLRNATFGVLGSLMPTPTPTLFGGEDSFYLDVSVPWTKVFLDGHLIRPPRNNDTPLKLARGRYLIEWRAEPFQTQSCIMSVPFALNGTCPFAADEPGQQIQDPSAEMILLHDSLTSLSARLQATLIGAVQKTFAEVPASQLVQPGELYAGPNGYATARQPLKATLHFQFNAQATGDQPYLIAGEVCQQLCIVPWQYLPSQKIVSPTEEWLALAFITASWEYATRNGHVIALGQPIDLASAGGSAYPVLLRIVWNGSGWNVKALIGLDQAPPIVVTSGLPHDPSTPPDKVQLQDNPSCVAARDLLGTFPANFQVRFVSGPNLATGCLAIVTGSAANTPSSSHPQVAYFLEHFGILLAVNNAAHKLELGAPLADAYERGLAQQLAVL